MSQPGKLFFSIFAFCLAFYCFTCFAQVSIPLVDSVHALDFEMHAKQSKAKDLADLGLKQSQANYRQHQLVLKQSRNFFLLKNEIEKARNFLRIGFKYHEIRDELIQLTRWREQAVDGVITNEDKIQTVPNLTTTSRLLNELLKRTDNRLQQILAYHRSLGHSQSRLDSLAMDSIIYQVPVDSASMTSYLQKLLFLTRDINPVNTKLKTSLDSIQKLEIQVNLLKFELESDIIETESLHSKVFQQFRTNELGFFGENLINDRPFGQIITYSYGKAKLAIFFYSVNHRDKIILILVFALGLYLYLLMLRRKVNNEGSHGHLTGSGHVLGNPLASAILISLTISQFFLPLPPFIFNCVIWILITFSLILILKKSFTPFLFKTWLFFILLFLLALISNLILRHSSFELCSMLLLSFSGVSAGIFFLVSKKKKEIKDRIIFVLIGLLALLQIPAIYFNLTGGFNLAKIFMTNGIFTFIVVLLFWTARFVNETLLISFYFYQGSEGKTRLLPDEKASKDLPFFYYLICFAGWFVLILRSTYYFQTLFLPFRDSLTTTRTIGMFSFNYQSILIFMLVIFLSALISRIVLFLSSDNMSIHKNSKKGGLGSWLVLIRIAIITAGVLVAFIAAGFPMDRFAIILGAVSVGIGFGLQTLVNNLISGLVIAFEKPVNVGDIVEFAGQTGRMKSIGIRSSVVTTWDGADVIIPNGDLLNQHLVNWTLGSSHRRFELLLGVAYGTDLDKTKRLLLDLMQNDSRILKDPQPLAFVTKFSSSSVHISLKFWVPHFDIGFDVRSDLIVSIDSLFRERGIIIPFPQQDVHIRKEVNGKGDKKEDGDHIIKRSPE
ncbi:MAG: mechanosensitive ion channel domain-containing protein [Bacteroidota bacterium]